MNGQSISDANHDDAAKAFKSAGSRVELVVQYNPVEFTRFQVTMHAHIHTSVLRDCCPYIYVCTWYTTLTHCLTHMYMYCHTLLLSFQNCASAIVILYSSQGWASSVLLFHVCCVVTLMCAFGCLFGVWCWKLPFSASFLCWCAMHMCFHVRTYFVCSICPHRTPVRLLVYYCYPLPCHRSV